MYYSYLDTSGGRLRKDHENFVLTSITIHESQIQHINQKTNEIKKSEFPEFDPNEIELHVKDMLKRKRFFQNVSREQSYRLLDKTFQFLSDDNTDYFIVACVIKKELMYESVDVEEWAYKFVLERINEEVILKNKQNDTNDNCKIIIDNEGERNFGISSQIKWELKHGTQYSKLESFDRDITFENSKNNNPLQIVDCIAYATRKHKRENNGNSEYTQKWRKYFNSIEPKFRHVDGQYKGIGLKIFPVIKELLDDDYPRLSGLFCKENKISELTILDEGFFINTKFGKRIECTVQCNDVKNSVKLWRITQKHWNYMFESLGGDTILWVNKKVPINTQYLKELEKYEILVTKTK